MSQEMSRFFYVPREVHFGSLIKDVHFDVPRDVQILWCPPEMSTLESPEMSSHDYVSQIVSVSNTCFITPEYTYLYNYLKPDGISD